jgi:hypothetical protein
MSVGDDWRQRVIAMSTERGDFVQDDSGYYVYWPDRVRGYVGAAELRIIADHLDAMNAEWDAQVQREVGTADTSSAPTSEAGDGR